LKQSKLDAYKENIVKRLAVGESQGNIATEMGVNQSSVSRFANREDIRTLIEQEQAKLIDCLPDAVQNYINLVREDIPKGDIKRRELQLKASKDVLKGGGLLPTPVQSQTFVNLYQENKPLLSPIVMEIISKKVEEITSDST
jgi:hypothetical protein